MGSARDRFESIYLKVDTQLPIEGKNLEYLVQELLSGMSQNQSITISPSSPNQLYQALAKIESKNLLLVTNSEVKEIDQRLFFSTNTSTGFRSKSYVSLNKISDHYDNIIVVALRETPRAKYKIAANTAIIKLADYKVRKSFLSNYRLAMKYIPSFSMKQLLTLAACKNFCKNPPAKIFQGNCGALNKFSFTPFRDMGVWESASENFESVNRGSREDGIQFLAEAYSSRDTEEEALFLLNFLKTTDLSAEVRQAANRVLNKRKSRIKNPKIVAKTKTVKLKNSWVYVKSGFFNMGSAFEFDKHSLPVEQPEHELYLDDFWISKNPISEHQWNVFCVSTGREKMGAQNRRKTFPVTNVSWYDASEFCNWYTKCALNSKEFSIPITVSLPTESEWEKAARGITKFIYPWGNKFELEKCNFRGAKHDKPVSFSKYSPVGDSPYGVSNMSGNVWEWTSSMWGKSGRKPVYSYPYDANDGREDLGAPSSIRRVIRGGSYYYFDYCVRISTRNVMYPDTRHSGGGFRIVARPKAH